ncbi:hypothetical protein HOD29_01795 [archaeon]|jgi:hypothetical protein|nr:hypothetical protein [archaeon]
MRKQRNFYLLHLPENEREIFDDRCKAYGFAEENGLGEFYEISGKFSKRKLNNLKSLLLDGSSGSSKKKLDLINYSKCSHLVMPRV